MRRARSTLLALTLVVAGIAFAGPVHAADPSTISSYVSDYQLGADGDLAVVETLTVTLPVPRHGIFRTFGGESIRPEPPLPNRDSITVTRDGNDEPVRFEPAHQGYTLRIGNPDKTITGTHVYRIAFTVTNAVNEGEEFDEFFWETVGESWEMRILTSRVTVHLPGPATDGSCGIGDGETGECEGVGTSTLHFATGVLEPGTSVSLRADYTVDERATLLAAILAIFWGPFAGLFG